MKSKIKTIVLALMLTTINLVANAAGSTYMMETRTSKPYHYLHIVGNLDVKIEQSAEPGVVVDGSKFQVYNTISILRDDTLFVYQTNVRKVDAKTNVLIRVDNLSLLEVKGDTKVDCSGLINSDMLMVRASDGAQIKIDVRALKVDSKATGCSHIDISGTSASAVEDVDGCGTIDSHLLDVMDKKTPDDILCVEC